MVSNQHIQDQVYAASISNPEEFWQRQASSVHWHRKPSKAFQKSTKHLKKSNVSHEHWEWFADDRHVEKGNGKDIAICWDSPVTGQKERYTYRQLLQEVETLAGVLREEGVKKGDVVLIYMPMIPAAVFAMLAIARLGAIHAVVFGGFSPAALAQRIEASHPVAIMTASCGIEGAKKPTEYKSMIEGAVHRSMYKPLKTIVWQREQLRWDPIVKDKGQRNWQQLVETAKRKGVKADAVAVKSGDGLYIIYTSGTTGLPKGVVRSAGGHAVGLNFSIKYLFGIHGPGDVMFTASDIGWVVGHSYIVYAPLLAGATTVLFEGKPIGTPDASTFWRVVEEYKVSTMFTAPTALRAIRRDDGENHFFETRGALVVDNWWSSESGSPISGIALSASSGLDFSSQERPKPLPIKPGSAGKAMPGFDVRVVDDNGKEVAIGDMGNIVIAIPLAPTAFTTLWKDEERFYKGYMKRFNGKWIDTGDAGMIDEEGYISIMSRADDVINVAAHRFSTGAIEQAITTHPSIAEAAVVGIPDALKGHLPFAFVTLSTYDHSESAVTDDKLMSEIQSLVREKIGAIASLGGIIQGKAMIPKTRSGKTLRRVLRELLENATHGEFDKEVNVPSTIEDRDAVNVARKKIQEYFETKGKHLHKATEARAKL
ncbi:acetyl-CoA synthetase-like protein [Stemphylium lycopersici]|uniref:Acetyl-CoA synthetase-like protein n=1 Tax=Stemphylium lycopersici TaxID=183478 RepID=A0A364N2H1_STELY|nr:acetyl-CoA synthetase-like protein [Stemphylium lycopersici]